MSSPRSPSDEQLEERLDWLEQLRKDSGVPESVDLDDAVLVHNNIADEDIATTTYSRWPIEYFMMGRERRYLVATVVAYAKKRFEEAAALRRTPPQAPYKKRIRRAAAPASQPHEEGEAPAHLATDAPGQHFSKQ
jgi:hypothetical protein